MAEESYITQTYRLRASSPMPVALGNFAGNFVLHTFGAEVSDVENYDCTENLPPSSDFRGQGGNLISASFSRIGERNGTHYQGRKTFVPDYIDEDDLGFNFG